MATYEGLVDQYGRKINKQVLTEEIGGPSLSGVRSPISGYPADGLTPDGLAAILKAADQGDPVRYLELAETIEERDLHYAGVLGTRKRAISQLEITVTAGDDEDERAADSANRVRDWLLRDELQEELFDILDAIGKGVSYTEIIWDFSSGEYEPKRLEWQDPRWFRPAREDLRTPLLLDEGGRETELPPFKFICANMRAKSGLPLRSGLARIVAWAWMFKAYTQRDWAIFTQTYGQPVRVGKYGSNATEAEKGTLFSAVANIAADCAAIIPASMSIEFVEASTTGTSMKLYEERANWLDRQVSKAVLGQTATTDAIAGGHAVGKEHREVQEDIERADARAIAAILNRDLIRPWHLLNFGEMVAAPRVRIGRPEEHDVAQTISALDKLVPMGVRVSQASVLDMIGLAEAKPDEAVLTPPAQSGAPPPPVPEPPDTNREVAPALHMSHPDMPAEPDAIADSAAAAAAEHERRVFDRIAELVDAAGDLEALRDAINREWPDVDRTELTNLMARALVVADLTGRTGLTVERDA